jgi:Crp-like helix-turn-helix domain
MALPLLALWLLLARPEIDLAWDDRVAPFVLVLATALVSVVLGGLIGRAARARDDARLCIDRFLITTMAGYVRRLSAMVLDAMYLPVEQRVRRQLVELAGIYGGDAQGAEIHLTQDDIANFAGTTRATANRVLRALESRGVLTLARGRIIIPDRDRLESSTR